MAGSSHLFPDGLLEGYINDVWDSAQAGWISCIWFANYRSKHWSFPLVNTWPIQLNHNQKHFKPTSTHLVLKTARRTQPPSRNASLLKFVGPSHSKLSSKPETVFDIDLGSVEHPQYGDEAPWLSSAGPGREVSGAQGRRGSWRDGSPATPVSLPP